MTERPAVEPTELPTDPADLIELLRSIDPVEAPELVGRIADALEAALAEADRG
ncbi:MAG: hypothetical protein AB1Z57_08910 [Acidimicrobiia bacterium]